MTNRSIGETLRVWQNVYRRIRFFRKMYPLSSILKDLFLFPVDYISDERNIQVVRNLTIAITHRCNIRCQMCYFHQELSNRYVLPFDLYKRVIDAASPRRPCLILSGGEPFTHPDLVEMVAYAKSRYLAVQIFTNGTLVKPEITDRLVEFGLDHINFTLLGNEKSHPMVTQVPRSYEMLVDNLAYFAEHRGNTQVMLNYTITPQALDDIDHAVELAKRYKLDGLRFQHYNFLQPEEFEAQGSVMQKLFDQPAASNEIEDMPKLSEMVSKITAFMVRLSKEAPNIPVQWAPTLTTAEMVNWYSSEKFRTQRRCLYPWRGILADADGKIYPCSKIYLPLGDLHQDDILSIWNSKDMKKFRKYLRKGLYPACSRCCKL